MESKMGDGRRHSIWFQKINFQGETLAIFFLDPNVNMEFMMDSTWFNGLWVMNYG